LELYRAGGVIQLLGGDNNSGPFACARIDGGASGSFAWARGLSAGRYAVCLRAPGSQSAELPYVLSIAATAP
jgi:hypothetical protein